MERASAVVQAQSARLAGHEGTLWTLAAVLLVGDVALTTLGLSLGLVETNPFGAALLARFGPAGLLGAKVLTATPALAWWVGLPLQYARFAPLFLTIPWGVACTVNLVLVTAVLL